MSGWRKRKGGAFSSGSIPRRRSTGVGRAGWNVGAYRRHARIRAGQRGALRVGGYYGRYSNGGELKFLDTVIDDAVVATGGEVLNTGTVNVIPQGVTESTRVGRKCTIKSVNWRWTVTLPTTTTPGATSDTVRLIMFLDKQCNGAAAAVAIILETALWNSWRNLENVGRIKVLYDKTISLVSKSGGPASTSTVNYGEDVRNGAFYKKCNIPIEFDASASTGAIGTIRSNNIGILVIAHSGFAGLQSNVRVRFSDA